MVIDVQLVVDSCVTNKNLKSAILSSNITLFMERFDTGSQDNQWMNYFITGYTTSLDWI